MRVLFVTRCYWPVVGGVESFVRELSHELAREHDVTVFARRIDPGPAARLTDSLTPPPVFEPFEDDGVDVQCFRIPRKRRVMMAPLGLEVLPLFRRYAYGRTRWLYASLYAHAAAPVIAEAARDADVIHMWGGGHIAAAAVRAADLTGVPLVITPFAHEGQWGDDVGSASAYRKADAVIGLLETDAKLYRQLGVSDDRLRVCGVCSPGVTPGTGETVRSQVGVRGPVVLFLGVRREYKGFDLLVEAAPLVHARHPDVTFAFAGPGRAISSAEAGGARVIDLGEVDDAGRAAWLDAADVLCLPSQGETFGMVILEAWSVETPVVVSDIPSLSELVRLSGGGVTVRRAPSAIAATISELLDEPARLREHGARGRYYWASHHTPAIVAAWHEHLYGRLAEAGRQRQ